MAEFTFEVDGCFAVGYDCLFPTEIVAIRPKDLDHVEGIGSIGDSVSHLTHFFKDLPAQVDTFSYESRGEVIAIGPTREAATQAAYSMIGVIVDMKSSDLETRVLGELTLSRSQEISQLLASTFDLPWANAWALPYYSALLMRRDGLDSDLATILAAEQYAPSYATYLKSEAQN